MSQFKLKDRILFFLVEHIVSRLVLVLGRTLDIELVGKENVEAARKLSKSGKIMLAVLHGRMFVPLYVMRDKNIHSIASQSTDGEVIARVVQKLGYVTFRGSSAKGGAEGMLGMIRAARKVSTANMIDGPTGPREVPKIGTVAIARAAGIPIVPLVGAAAPSLELEKAWDRFQLPLPFSKAVNKFGEPMMVPNDAKGEKLEESRLELQRRVVAEREWVDARAWERAMERRGGLLAPAAWLWDKVSTIRNRFFDTGVRRVVPSPVPVISIGNLTAGGSGKSPLVKELVNQLEEKVGKGHVAIVSRGYRRTTSGMRVVADKRGLLLSAAEGGDEPVMLAGSLPGVPIIVAERRPEAIAYAELNYRAKVVVLDDGFQHRAAERMLDIVLLDASAPASQWRMIPQGRMREGFSSLKRAGLVVITGVAPEGIVEGLRERARQHTEAPILRGGIEPVGLTALEGDGHESVEWASGRKFAVSAAIARPRRFIDSVEGLGAEVVAINLFKDHEPMDRQKVDEVMQRAQRKGAEAVLITPKDAVKWPALREDDLPVYIVETRWRWSEGEEELAAAVQALSAETKNS